MNNAKLAIVPDLIRGGNGRDDQAALTAYLTEALQTSEAALRAIGEISPFGIFVSDVDGRSKYINPAITDILSQCGDHYGERWQEAIHPDEYERLRLGWANCVRTGHSYRSCHRFVKRSGEVMSANIVVTAMLDQRGGVSGIAGTIENLTPLKAIVESELALRRSEQRYRQIVDTAQEGIWLRDAEARTIFVNRRMCEILGYTQAEMMGRPVYDFMDADGRADAEMRFIHRQKGECQQHDVRYKHKDGSDVWAIVSASPMYDEEGVFLGGLGMITDITERKRHEETIRWQAYHDPLTGLPNRSLLEDRLHQILIMSERQDLHTAVLFIDLDHFKQVNDTLGHDFGDQLLQVAAGRIASCLRAEDTVARLGGDEFTALLPGIGQPDAAANIAQKLLEALALPVEIWGKEVSISGSIGISLHPEDSSDAQSLLKHADVAMYHSKEQGGNRYCIFGQSVNAIEMNHRATKQAA